MLVIPPRSQQLKLSLSYQDWENIQRSLGIAATTMTKERNIERLQNLAKEVGRILEQLRREGHV